MRSVHHDRWPTTKSVGVPCYGCGKLSTCTIHPDLSACKCWRDGGAIHRRGAGTLVGPSIDDWRPPVPKPEPPKLSPEWVSILATKFQTRVDEEELQALSRQLRVSAASLHRLGIGWDGTAWTFPMFDGNGTPIGLHRRFPDGRKICLRGSRLGLFIPYVTEGGNGNKSPQQAANGAFVTQEPPPGGLVLPPPPAALLICEGASDTAAALTLGYGAVGLPSAGQGADLLVAHIQRTHPPAVVIIADLDEGSSGANGKTTWPGIEGGLALAARLMPLHRNLRFCLPPAGVKDLRQWMGRNEWNEIRAAIEASPQVNPGWMNQARQNVLENRRSRCTPSWAQRAAMLLAGIPDGDVRADLRERFEERAGIMEYEGNLPRDEAERLAYEELCRNAGQG